MEETLEVELEKIKKEEEKCKNKTNALDSRIKFFNAVAWAAVIIGFLIGVSGIIYKGEDLKLHELGDFIGGSTASLWSLAGLFFIYIAFLGQQKQMLLQNLDIKYNRFELKLSRQELREQKEQSKLQTKNLIKQNFEDTFFKLISLHKENLNQWVSKKIEKQNGKIIREVKKQGISTLRSSFKIFNDSVKLRMRNSDGERNSILQTLQLVRINDFELQEPYFEHISRTYELIMNSKLDDGNQFYYNILSTQLNSREKLYYRYYLIYKQNNELLKILHKNTNVQMLIDKI